MSLFHFTLRPVNEITPWGTAPNLSLSWFGLTDGHYWLQAGNERLFTYSAQAVQHLSVKYPEFRGDDVDYQVARLWEDVLALLPDALTPVPSSLADMLTGPAPRALCIVDRAHQHWQSLDEEASEFEAAEQRYYDASLWLRRRNLDSMYLAAGPKVWIWSTPDNVTITWDNRKCSIDGVPAWSTIQGCYTLPRSDFLAEVRDFNDRFIAQMAGRVDDVGRDWRRPEVAIDLDGLRREHEERAHAFERALSSSPEPEDWTATLEALDYFARLPGDSARGR